MHNRNKRRASTVEYTKILQERGFGSSEAERYKSLYSYDGEFVKRANIVELLFKNRDAVLSKIGTADPQGRSAG